MSSTLLIFNPNSDRGRSGQKASDLRSLVDHLGGADWAGTEYPAHATEIAAQAADKGYKTVIALGGDGTVHEVINGLMQIEAARRPALGIVPIGTGNDFAYAAGVNMTPAEAIQRAFTGERHPIDVVHMQDDQGRAEYFNNTAGIGFDAAINIQTRRLRGVYGFLMYLTATLWTVALKFDTPHLKITYDGGVIDQPVLMLTLGNGPREGGGFITTPMSKVDDGVLDFVYVSKVTRARILQLIPTVMKGTHIHEPEVKCLATTRMTVESEQPMPIHLDGELFAPYEANVRRVDVKLLPGALTLVR